MEKGQSLSALTAKIIHNIDEILLLEKPDIVFVHGDTTTSFSTALACYYNKILVAHVEAGLRTQDIFSPWPEELNRQLTGRIADFHFCPTETNYNNCSYNVKELIITPTTTGLSFLANYNFVNIINMLRPDLFLECTTASYKDDAERLIYLPKVCPIISYKTPKTEESINKVIIVFLKKLLFLLIIS